MANTASYPIIAPKAGDLLVGTQTYTVADKVVDNPTRNFTVASVASLANSINLGYTVYTALLTQAGTAVPVATVLQNTTGGTIAWTRTGAGTYTGTITGSLFTLNKTMVFINNGSTLSNLNISWASPTTSTITIGASADSVLTAASLEIRIYS
jgi:hypothetical protein